MLNYINISIIDILSNVLSKMRAKGNIMSITDNSNNTYTVVVDNIKYLKNNYVITITNTTNFNGDYVISGVNLTSKSFIINKTSGYGSTIGYYNSVSPEFMFEKWAGAKNEVLQFTSNFVTDAKKYPLCLLLLDIDENYEDGYVIYPELTTYFFIQTDAAKSSEWRHENTMPILRSLYADFMNLLKSNTNIESNYTHSKSELFYVGTADKNQNKLGSILDAIEIKIRNLKLINEIC